ncbi:Signal transduction histidine kinase [Halovenus aranensis]|uniref:histidine kinase n=1 Tax=Halovenus aranensis TaxID=890420 RepID=A0A1G8W8P6_9EURY|nr:histidine kinase N-terminal 7TM domain-containing protein [Halovenus aranensis]SDJ74506.1 Signal transduction histidine kinase [Halovenus aranensis]
MSVYLTWPVLLSLFAGVATLGLFAYLVSYRAKPGASWFAATMVAQAVFVFAYGIGLTVFSEELRLVFEVIALIGLTWLGPPFVGFALEYTGRGAIRRSWYYWLLYLVPVMTLVLLPVNHSHGLFWTNFTVDPVFGVAAASYDFGPLFYVMLIGGTGWSVVGVLLLVDTVWDYGSLFRSEALAVVASAILPAVGLLIWMLELTPNSHFIWAAPLFAGHVIFDYYAFVGKGMFEIYPATNRAAKQSALDDFRAPVLVLEEQHRIVDLNPAAVTQLELDREATVFEPVGSVVESLDPDGWDGPETFGRYLEGDDEWRITAQVGTRRREYVIQPSPLTAGGRERVGYTLLFQDITEEVRREERLAVLNRILRHNLRNDLSIVSGYVAAADSHTDDEMVEQMLTKVSVTVDELIDTGEMAREFEQLLAAPNSYSRTIATDELTERLADRLAEDHPDAALSVQTTETVFETNPDVLEAVLWQLLENAATHTDEPTISLSVTSTEETIDIEVSDDGDGIPDHELQSLETGEETSLKHGSGFGLWLAKWGTVRVGGNIDFDASDAGTTVTVSLPRENQETAGQTSSASA